MEERKVQFIDVKQIASVLWRKRIKYLYVMIISVVLSCIWILPQPRYYDCEVTLAPESNGESLSGGLSSIASSFGFNVGDMASNDAIYPMLYPDLFESPEFLVGLFNIKVKTLDGEIETDYYTYLKDFQKQNLLTMPFRKFSKYITDLLGNKDQRESVLTDGKINPFLLSKTDYELMENMKDKVSCSVDKRTDVISISVRDQDALVCAIMADSVKEHLQYFIIQYRTSKARQDCNYYQHLTDSAKTEYEEALRLYTEYCDTHKDVILQAYISERDKLENDMSVKYNTYNAFVTQLQAMKAKVQERTPSFTTLKSATVPIKPSGPKRMFFVIGVLCFVSFIFIAYQLKGVLWKF